MNEAIYLLISGHEDEYRVELGKIRGIFSSIPTWLRNLSVERYQEVISLGLRYRPKIASQVARFRDDILRIDHEIAASNRLYCSPTPPRTAAKVESLRF